MTSHLIRGVCVEFPFDPYQCQFIFMEKVIEALQEGHDALLESPTGTGKTLCLLTASLAWREKMVEEARNSVALGMGDERGAAEYNARVAAAVAKVPKIIYASRTHSQLSQVVKELRNTRYSPVMSVLGSRTQLCIHPQVNAASRESRNQRCRSLVANRKCRYHAKVESFHEQHPRDPGVRDIEDMQQYGRDNAVCPFYLSREAAALADIVFLPYNYLIDAQIRRTLSIDLNDSVLIFDEAHNLEGVCTDSCSFELSADDLRDAAASIAVAYDLANDKELDLDLEPDLVRRLSCTLQKIINSFAGTSLDREGQTRDAFFWYELLGSAGITLESSALCIKGLEGVLSVLTDPSNTGVLVDVEQRHKRGAAAAESTSQKQLPQQRQTGGKRTWKVRGRGLSKLLSALRIMYEGAHALRMSAQQYSQYFQINFCSKRNEFQGTRCKTLNFWCFYPGVAMRLLSHSFSLHNIILASGTLSPMEAFSQELGLAFPVRLENPHVIDRSQLWAGVVSVGPSGQLMNASYKNRDNPEYLADLGNALSNFARIVPDGLLVFFPSYGTMDQAITAWQGSSVVWNRLNQHKRVIVEPRDSYKCGQAMDDFYNKINDPEVKGVIFMAVCRGKVSEGMDFTDRRGRAVIVTGIPYPNLKDARVQGKRRYLDALALRHNNNNVNSEALASAEPSSTLLSGNEWYTQQATRAVNQAIGRVIRHRFDYGAMIFLDHRFSGLVASSSKQKSGSDTTTYISKWIQPYVRSFRTFGESVLSLTRYFKGVALKVDALKEKAGVKTAKQQAGEREAVKRKRSVFAAASAGESGRAEASKASERSAPVVHSAEQDDKKQRKKKKVAAAQSFMHLARKELTQERYRRFQAVLRQYKCAEITIFSMIDEALQVFHTVAGLRAERALGTAFRTFVPKAQLDYYATKQREVFVEDMPTRMSSESPQQAQQKKRCDASAPDTTKKVMPDLEMMDLIRSRKHSTTPSPSLRKKINAAPAVLDREEALLRKIRKKQQRSTKHLRPQSEGNTTGMASSAVEKPVLVLSPQSHEAALPEAERKRARRAANSETPGDDDRANNNNNNNDNSEKGGEGRKSNTNVVSVDDVEVCTAGDDAASKKSGVDCPICRDVLSSPFAGPCGHICCHSCWVGWLKVKLECPVCKQKARKKTLRKLYF